MTGCLAAAAAEPMDIDLDGDDMDTSDDSSSVDRVEDMDTAL